MALRMAPWPAGTRADHSKQVARARPKGSHDLPCAHLRRKHGKSVGGALQNSRTSDGNPSKVSEVPFVFAVSFQEKVPYLGAHIKLRGQSLKRASDKDWRLELRGQSLKRASDKEWRLELRGQSLKRAAGKDWRLGLALHASTPCRLFYTRRRRKVSEQKPCVAV